MPPTIIREIPQPTTGSNEGTQLLNRAGYIIIQSVTNPQNFVEVLAGEAAPTPSGGYPKWARIPRPQRSALTILEGYEPMVLTVALIFDAVRENGVREDVEHQIQILEGLAGRGIAIPQGYRAATGKPTLLKVYSNQGASAVQLVPKQFQTANVEWFIEDILWDEHPLRHPAGDRIRQMASVKFVQFVKDPQIQQQKASGFTVHRITHSLPNVRSLVKHYLQGPRSRLNEAVSATIKENAFNKAVGTNPYKPLKVRTEIRIPNEFTKEA